MLLDRICREASCGRSFKGGPRAYYCPSCRAERQRQQKADNKRKKRLGLVRAIGSTDTCERCSKLYTVNGGNQRFCPECQPIHAAQHDRETSITFYHDNKDRTNPPRNERRRKGMKNCEWCGKEFPDRVGSPKACSEECRKQFNRKWQRDRYALTKQTRIGELKNE